MRDPQPRYVGITTVTAIEITTVTGRAPIPPVRTAHIHKSQITHVNTPPLLFFFFSPLLRFILIPRSGDIPFLEYTQYQVSLFLLDARETVSDSY